MLSRLCFKGPPSKISCRKLNSIVRPVARTRLFSLIQICATVHSTEPREITRQHIGLIRITIIKTMEFPTTGFCRLPATNEGQIRSEAIESYILQSLTPIVLRNARLQNRGKRSEMLCGSLLFLRWLLSC